MNLPRDQYYKKEVDFRLSCSYGPGRYDPVYEEQGVDYPFGYVRWTEQRNMAAFLQLVAEGKVTPAKLVTHRFEFDEALEAYQVLLGVKKEPYLGIVLEYSWRDKLELESGGGESWRDKLELEKGRGESWRDKLELEKGGVESWRDKLELEKGRGESWRDKLEKGGIERRVDFHSPTQNSNSNLKLDAVGVSFIGCGNFAKAVLLPTLKKTKGACFRGVSTATGMSAADTAKKYGFAFAATDQNEVLKDAGTNLVFVTTRHDLHAAQIAAALAAGKYVFSEKPLCINEGQLEGLVVGVGGGFNAEAQRRREDF